MKGVIYHTDKEWFNYLITNNLLTDVNFWTKRRNNLKIQEGDVFFFKTSDQEILGMADVKSYEKSLSINDTWLRFGSKNGVNNLKELESKLKNTLGISEYEKISVIILDNLVKFKQPIKLKNVGLEKIQVMKYIGDDKIKQILEEANIVKGNQNINLDSVDPKFQKSLTKHRLFQHELRKLVLKKYNNKCLICGIDNENLLKVSHIKPVKDSPEYAGKIDNTLLLCSLHDSLFDSGLISIDKNGKILISDELRKTNSDRLIKEIEDLEKSQIERELGLDFESEFFEYHRKNIFKK
jgi:Predicted restriction endonuclease